MVFRRCQSCRVISRPTFPLLRSIEEKHDSLKVLVDKLGIPNVSNMALAPLVTTIGVKVQEVLGAKDELATNRVTRAGVLDVDMSVIPITPKNGIPAATSQPLNSSMGMSQTQEKFFFLVTPTLTHEMSREEFQSRYDELIKSGLVPQGSVILSLPKASHALAYAHHVNSRKITVARWQTQLRGKSQWKKPCETR